MRKNISKATLLAVLLLSFSSVAVGQNMSAYLDTRIKAIIDARIEQTDTTKQSAPPAATGNSTSLVERSSAPDLLGFGLDFLNLSDSAGSKKSAAPKTLTFSAYALKSLFSGQDALDPAIYNSNRTARSLSFTLGYDVPENTDDRDPVIGIKWLAINGRDVSNSKNDAEIQVVQTALNSTSVAFSNIAEEVELFLFSTLKTNGRLAGTVTSDAFEGTLGDPAGFQALLSSLTDDEKKSLDGIISKRISAFVNLDTASRNAVKAIRTRAQLALAFTTTQRKGGRPDEYNGTLTFDKGMGTNSISMNGSFIFKRNGLGEDTSGGKFAAAFHLPLSGFKPLDYKDPMLLSIEGDATAMTKTAPIYKAQAKLTIPLMAGMEIPISVSVANRTEFVNEKEVKGKFGFTFDVSKALKAFRDSFVKIP
jgi:hypothetical protein